MLKHFRESITERPLLCIALMLFWTWLNLAFQGPLFFPPVKLANGLIVSTWFAPIVAAALAYFMLGIWFRRTNSIIRKQWCVAVVAALMMVGALLCFLWINGYGAVLDQDFPLMLYAAGSLLIGMGTAMLMIEWGRIFGYLGPQQALYHGITGMLGSAVIVVALSFSPQQLDQIIFALIPLPLAFCLHKTLAALPLKTLYQHGLNAELKVPYKFLATALLHGLSLGVLMGWLYLFGDETRMSVLTALSFIVAAALLLLTAVFLRRDFNHLIYQIGFGIMATGALLIAVFIGFPAIGVSLQLVGFCYVHLIMWGLCAYLIKNFKLPAPWVIAWPTCCLMLGQLLGGITSSYFAQQAQATWWIETLSTCMIFLLLAASLVMMSNRNLMTGWGLASPAHLIPADTTRDSAIEQLIREKNLTPREGEILALMARGRNRKVISAELFISEETTKSHINGLYRKLDIHSQQELLNLVEGLAVEHRSEEKGSVFG